MTVKGPHQECMTDCWFKLIMFQTHVQVCDIDPDVTTLLKKFKFRKEKNVAAIVCKYKL